MRRLKQLWTRLPGRPATAAVWFASLVALTALGGWPMAASAQRFAPDPVEELRQTLKQSALRDRAAHKLRQQVLEKRAKALQTVSDLGRALLLEDWQDESESEDDLIREVDQTVRTEIARRFTAAIDRIIGQGDAASKLAVAHLIGEMAVATRTQVLKVRFLRGQVANVVPGLITLTRSDDPRLRAAAAQSLGKIQPEDPKIREEAVQALGRLLTDGSPLLRRAAAEALLNQVRLITQTEKKSRPDLRTEDFRKQLIEVGTMVVPAVGPGLADKADAQVRRLSAEALQQVAVALADVIGDIRTSEYTPPEGRPLTEREKKDLELFAANVQAERKEVRPLLVALQGQMKALAQAVSDPSADVRILARGALEAIAHTRDRLLRKEENIQRAQRAAGPPENKQGRRLPQAPVVLAAAAGTPVKLQDDVLLDGFQQSKAVSALAAGLMDRDERARLAAVHALEMLGKDGAVAAPALVRSLTDPDRFVRWAAARALGKMAPADAESAVPALARLLSDSDLDLRLAAATALDLYGPEAKAAVPALAESVSNGDAESRIAALRALEGIGGAADAAVPAIARAMIENPDVRVRRTAAEVLGRFGPRADQAIPALRKALDDPDTSVRKAASEALLNIKPVQ